MKREREWEEEKEAEEQRNAARDQKEMERQTMLKQLEEEYWRSKQAPAGSSVNGDK